MKRRPNGYRSAGRPKHDLNFLDNRTNVFSFDYWKLIIHGRTAPFTNTALPVRRSRPSVPVGTKKKTRPFRVYIAESGKMQIMSGIKPYGPLAQGLGEIT
jgi:hypothetical protein